ncbi:unnamed protein product, partial [Polarella glacialis]
AASKDRAWTLMLMELVAVPAGEGAHEGGAAFVHACRTLELLVRGDEELAKALHQQRLLAAVGQRLLAGTTGGERDLRTGKAPEELPGTSWQPFANAAVVLIDALVSEKDPDRFSIANPELFRPVWMRYHRPEPVVDGCIAALERSLFREGSAMVASQLHVAGLRALTQLARLSKDQAERILLSNGPSIGVEVMRLAGYHEEATSVSLVFLVQISGGAFAHNRLKAAGADVAAKEAATRFPRSQAVQDTAAKVVAACSDLKVTGRA